ncbi:MAG TPA: uracil-DNA glycosylase [Allosphingosinicella sp.]|nr:uracil-DNA glycosylase [Allosphingosinicella sp.]
MTPRQFLAALSALRFDNTFNPYSEHCATHDLAHASDIRSQMLLGALEAASRVGVDALWIGRDLGYRGGRRTGLPFTDDVHLRDHLARWNIEGQRPTKGKPVSERSANVVWKMLNQIDRPIFLWNVFPLHPHGPGAPFTNRMHNAAESRAGKDLLFELIALLRPKRLIAVGNDAEGAIRGIVRDLETIKIRHPSYGGQTEFSNQVRGLYKLRPTTLF